MATEMNWTCDWCKTRVEHPKLPPFYSVKPDIELAQKGRHDVVYLFPDDMRGHDGGPMDSKWVPSDFEGDLCDDCVQEIVSAVLRAREVRISKRPKKP
jgi:hypothetical protein